MTGKGTDLTDVGVVALASLDIPSANYLKLSGFDRVIPFR
jgi:hypothetical protein